MADTKLMRNVSTFGMHILIVGNPVDGLKFYGPYTTGDEAIEAAASEALLDWWIAPLESLAAR